MRKIFISLLIIFIPVAVVFTGCFSSNTYDIIISSPVGGRVICDELAKEGEIVTLSYDNVQNGYEFSHFTINGSKIDGDEFLMPAFDIVVSAVFSKIVYNITYHLDLGVSLTGENTSYNTYSIGSAFKLPDAKKDGSNFEGWYLQSDFSGEKIESISPTMYGNLNLYPKFNTTTYSIIYYNCEQATNNNPTSYLYGTQITLTNPTKTDYQFKGWYDNATFTGNKITQISSTTSGTVTLYAKFISTKVDGEGYCLITSPIDFIEIISSNLEGKYKLTSHLDFTNYSYTPIGTCTIPFSGTIDGNGYDIRRLKINELSEYCGIFGCINNATIKNLGITYLTISGETSSNSQIYVGALAGKASNCKIEDIGVAYVVINLIGAPYASVGTIVGHALSNTEITNSIVEFYDNIYSRVFVKGNLLKVGGICGQLTNGANINKCYVRFHGKGGIDTYTLTSASQVYCGGLVGYSNLGYISNSFVRQDLNSGIYVHLETNTSCEGAIGGIVGNAEYNSQIEDCYAEVCTIMGSLLIINSSASSYMYSGAVAGKTNTSTSISNCFAIGTNASGTRTFDFGLSGKYGYMTAYLGEGVSIENCYVESTVTNSGKYYADLSLINKSFTYNYFKTKLGWSTSIWVFSQSQYVLPYLI